VTRAGKNREARILGEVRITGREFAENERRAAIGFNPADMGAIGAKSCVCNFPSFCRVLGHGESIAARGTQQKRASPKNRTLT